MLSPARFASRHPRLVIALHVALLAVALVGLRHLEETDDLLDFIPPGDRDVQVFNRVNEKFGALRVALIGVQAPAGDDVFSPEFLTRLDAATRALKAVHGVDRVVSLSSLVDFTPSESAVQVAQLVDHPPRSPEERAALKARVMSREHIVGSFVSRDGRAALLLVFLAPPPPHVAGQKREPARTVAYALRDAAKKELAPYATYFGGAPFATASIYDETQSDIRRLTPLALLFILAVVLIAFREPVGVALTVVTVAWAVLLVLGGMGFAGEPYTVVSATLPVILFASGSSYAVHVLGRYYALGGREAGPGAVVEAAKIVTPPVVIAGLTTSSGFLSFLVMDIRPMRTFGIECAAGVLLCMIASLTLVPAVMTLWPRPAPPPSDTGRLGELLATVGRLGQRYRWLVLGGSALLMLATVGPMLRVEVRMEPSSFFRKGSEPWQAERFLDDVFGGSQFLQVALDGDLTDPATLREVERLAEYARSLPNVSQVQSIVEPLELVNDAMGGGMRLPETQAQVTNLLFFVEGEPSLRMLLTPDRKGALVHIRIRGDVHPAMNAVEEFLATRLRHQPVAPTVEDVVDRVTWIARSDDDLHVHQRQIQQLVAAYHPLDATDPELVTARRHSALAAMAAEGQGVPPPIADAATRERLADAIAKSPRLDDALQAQVVAAAPSADEGASLWDTIVDELAATDRRVAVARAAAPLAGKLDARALDRVRATLEDLHPLHVIAPSATPLQAALAGEPVLDRGLSRSVGMNQLRSLVVSMIAVLILMGLLFRSPWLAFVSVFPSALTMAIVFGVMGLGGVRIDIGTSLVASITTGAGSDFAMHYLWYLRRLKHEDVVRFVGPIMVISTLLVGLGFAVLGLGKAQPMRLFGGLAGASMALAALVTFLLVPALVGRLDRALSEGEGS